ncbi:hypothetical protein LHYA1_G007624 [Lachnellula hyalina]|uniref:Extracellular membrane protein CFEM domain-containing protein n=1 Tax=Lachnellula hyalina TaxID=1316788 RepID=A0A8H8TY63_9HELO|nr:uncharacterized protein LHYA1_G007624 [Lachnellula hyalina]TVY23621.1 hypothetical protein LHYA1_G007624 [Lachnellula hyalina]
MQFSTLFLSAASLFLAATASPTALIERQSSPTSAPVNTSQLQIGACLSLGQCYFDGNEGGCAARACANDNMLGSICSCNTDVQSVIDVQNAKGRKEWPIKCM